MGYWLMKTEPGEWGWDHQERNGGHSQWDGVRNAQAQNNIRSMRQGDHAFFYHSGKGPAVVGVVEVVKAAYPDTTDESGKHSMVDVRALVALPKPVPLSVIKSDEAMRDWVLLRQSRLSVMPVSPAVWARVCELGELSPPLCLTANEDDGAVSEIKETGSEGTQPKRTTKKKKKQETIVRDSSETEEEPKERTRRLPVKRKNGVSTAVQNDVKQEKQPTESEVVSVSELKTYQRVIRSKVGIVEVSVIAPNISKRHKSRASACFGYHQGQFSENIFFSAAGDSSSAKRMEQRQELSQKLQRIVLDDCPKGCSGREAFELFSQAIAALADPDVGVNPGKNSLAWPHDDGDVAEPWGKGAAHY